MPNNHRALVLTVLSRHIGRGNGISVRGLEQQLDMLPRAIRTHIGALRNDGHAICGTPRDGYFIAATADELEHTCEFLYARAMCSLKQISRMKKIPLPDLRGQLHLPT